MQNSHDVDSPSEFLPSTAEHHRSAANLQDAPLLGRGKDRIDAILDGDHNMMALEHKSNIDEIFPTFFDLPPIDSVFNPLEITNQPEETWASFVQHPDKSSWDPNELQPDQAPTNSHSPALSLAPSLNVNQHNTEKDNRVSQSYLPQRMDFEMADRERTEKQNEEHQLSQLHAPIDLSSVANPFLDFPLPTDFASSNELSDFSGVPELPSSLRVDFSAANPEPQNQVHVNSGEEQQPKIIDWNSATEQLLPESSLASLINVAQLAGQALVAHDESNAAQSTIYFDKSDSLVVQAGSTFESGDGASRTGLEPPLCIPGEIERMEEFWATASKNASGSGDTRSVSGNHLSSTGSNSTGTGEERAHYTSTSEKEARPTSTPSRIIKRENVAVLFNQAFQATASAAYKNNNESGHDGELEGHDKKQNPEVIPDMLREWLSGQTTNTFKTNEKAKDRVARVMSLRQVGDLEFKFVCLPTLREEMQRRRVQVHREQFLRIPLFEHDKKTKSLGGLRESWEEVATKNNINTKMATGVEVREEEVFSRLYEVLRKSVLHRAEVSIAIFASNVMKEVKKREQVGDLCREFILFIENGFSRWNFGRIHRKLMRSVKDEVVKDSLEKAESKYEDELRKEGKNGFVGLYLEALGGFRTRLYKLKHDTNKVQGLGREFRDKRKKLLARGVKCQYTPVRRRLDILEEAQETLTKVVDAMTNNMVWNAREMIGPQEIGAHYRFMRLLLKEIGDKVNWTRPGEGEQDWVVQRAQLERYRGVVREVERAGGALRGVMGQQLAHGGVGRIVCIAARLLTADRKGMVAQLAEDARRGSEGEERALNVRIGHVEAQNGDGRMGLVSSGLMRSRIREMDGKLDALNTRRKNSETVIRVYARWFEE